MTKVVFMGTPEFSVPVLQSLIDHEEYEVILVVSQPDKKKGRKQIITPSPVSLCAMENDIPIVKPINIKKEYQEILDTSPDIIITCAYGQIIPEQILNAPKYGCINVHASLLPKFRGGAPIQKAIITGEETTGITIMYMDKLMDSGDIINQEEIKIEETDNLETLTRKLSQLGKKLLMETLPSILAGTNNRIKQDPSKVTFSYNITLQDEHIDFNKSCREVFNQVRGLSPNPAGFVKLKNKIIKIYNGYQSKERSLKEPGEIVKFDKEGIGVCTKDYLYIITELKLEGKKQMKVKEYLNGCKDKLIGEKYE